MSSDLKTPLRTERVTAEQPAHVLIVDANDVCIATVPATPHQERIVSLILAAPELLHHLRVILDDFNDCYDGTPGSNRVSAELVFYAENALLALAKQGQP